MQLIYAPKKPSIFRSLFLREYLDFCMARRTDSFGARCDMIGIVVIAASAGGHDPLFRIIAALPVPCTAAIFVVMHVGSNPSILPELLTKRGKHPAIFPKNGTLIEAGHIYVAPPDHHMLVESAGIRLTQRPTVHYARPAADPLFLSAAKAHGQQVIGIVLSGGGGDGAAGLRAITEHGGSGFVQDPKEAAEPSMPNSAIKAPHPYACLPADEITQRVRTFCSVRGSLIGSASSQAASRDQGNSQHKS